MANIEGFDDPVQIRAGKTISANLR